MDLLFVHVDPRLSLVCPSGCEPKLLGQLLCLSNVKPTPWPMAQKHTSCSGKLDRWVLYDVRGYLCMLKH